MITEPSKQVLRDVDWTSLRKIEARLDAARDKGPLDETTFRALWVEGLVATHNHPELLQTLAMFGRPEWMR